MRKTNRTQRVDEADLARAMRLFKQFREDVPRQSNLTVSLPGALAHIGTCEFIGYVTTHHGKPALYVHFFAPGSRPGIYGNTGRGECYLIGGRYKMTSGGFTDLDAHGRLVDYKPRFKIYYGSRQLRSRSRSQT